MSYETVHTIGTTVYFVFFLLFLWAMRVPRTNPGAGWWAVAMLFALSARLVLILFLQQESRFTLSVYSALNVVEKVCLVIGMVRFFNVRVPLRWFWWALAAIEIWILLVWAGGAPALIRSAGVALFNAAILSCVAWLAWRERARLNRSLMCATALLSALLVLHWLSAFLIIEAEPSWSRHGFMLGTVLVLAQYFSLLAAVMLSFQKRLLEAESRALDLAFQDPLTGLSNQRYMTALFEKALLLANRPHQLAAIIYIDIDNFKPINDRAGHRVGDEVLKLLAGRLRKSTRSTDICARVGGDEFVAICTQLDDAGHAHEIAAKILREMTTPISVGGKDYLVGASIGVSLYPMHGDSLARLLDYADQAMYQVKSSGKNGYRVHEAAETAPA
ncbi:GGDEF domain-containing protein [Tahibacter harae]|uniref:GGDEF domain-containing protein n=1 Tax=Tahibacter harae TaxID=2963937 RepID=A0ABT1QUY1_9GAMM|nr:GGDEF domain-containing protein [Tahibacter harae]MCQ4166096.1 GGDEF domain-containing protein [Tahibacter harae]